MKDSVLNGKRILAVDDEVDVLNILEEEIQETCPACHFERATTYKMACELMASFTYDLLILDIMGVRGFDILKLAVERPFPLPVVILTAHSFTPEALKHSIELGARAYLPKETLGKIVPFLEDIMKYEYGPGWKRVLKQMQGLFSSHWGPYWQKSEEEFWKEFNRKISGPDA